MSQTSDEILASRRDGLAMRLHGLFYPVCHDSGQKAIDSIIQLQDRVAELEREKVAGVFKQVMTSLENNGTTVTIPLKAIEDETYVFTGLDQQRYRIVRDDRTVIDTDAIKPGFELTTLEGSYVLVPRAYEGYRADTNGKLTAGSGPEGCTANPTDNPIWVWHHAGNAALLASQLERMQKEAAFDG